MNLTNINNFLLVFYFLFFSSCQKIDDLRNKEEKTIISNSIEEIENIDKIKNISRIHNKEYIDHYTSVVNFLWKNKPTFEKKITLNNSLKNYNNFSILTFPIINNQIYSFEDNSILKIYNLDTGKETNDYEIDIISSDDFFYSTSLAKINNSFFVGFSNGTLINFDIQGNIIWQQSFNDILKTPIKIHNKNLIVILSDTIISINSTNGEINWSFTLEQKKSLSSLGGLIISKNHLLYFVLPNGRIGEVDTIIGELINSSFANLQLDQNLLNINNSLHIYQNFVSFFEDEKYLHTIDTKNDEFLVKKYKIQKVTSHYFKNNALLVLNNKRFLKAYNILNNKIFFKIDLSDYISKKEKIINILNGQDSLIIFFSSGLILEVDIFTGKIIDEQKLKARNIYSINFFENYLIVNKNNGKTIFYKK